MSVIRDPAHVRLRRETSSNGNYTQELARCETSCWPARRGRGGGDDGFVELHNRAVRYPGDMDYAEHCRLD